jgi:hypothetical protein
MGGELIEGESSDTVGFFKTVAGRVYHMIFLLDGLQLPKCEM